jgi:hypothetical protein
MTALDGQTSLVQLRKLTGRRNGSSGYGLLPHGEERVFARLEPWRHMAQGAVAHRMTCEVIDLAALFFDSRSAD